MHNNQNAGSWDNYKFHCSGLGNLMVSGKAKDEMLGETAKAYLTEVWIAERFGRKKYDNVNRYTTKGIMVESDSLELVSEVLGETLFKNNTLLENEFICGTPDVIKPSILDVKSSYDIWTFFNSTEKKGLADYKWQLKGYMSLHGTTTSRLVYALVDTPDEIMTDELYRASFKLNEEQLKKAENNFKYGDIKPEIRVKVYTITLDPEDEVKIAEQVTAARVFLKGLDAQIGITE